MMVQLARKEAGTKPPRQYDTTRYCVLKLQKLIRDGYDLFLTSNGVILIFDDLPLDYFYIVDQFPYVGFNAFSKTSGHGLPPEVQVGTWRFEMTVQQKYEEYLSSDEISKYLENDQLVEYRIPKNNPPKRRQTAWEFMGQEVPAGYLNLLDNLFKERRRVEVPSGSASAEVVGTKASTVEASSSSAPAEVFDVDAEISAMNNAETQAVQIISENPWHLYRAGVLTLRDNKGERATNPYGEPVLIIREFFMMSTSQQESLRAQGITRHIWERFPLAGHSVFFSHVPGRLVG